MQKLNNIKPTKYLKEFSVIINLDSMIVVLNKLSLKLVVTW